MMKKLSYKYYNKRTTTRDDGNVQSHDKNKESWTLPLMWTVLTHLHMIK